MPVGVLGQAAFPPLKTEEEVERLKRAHALHTGKALNRTPLAPTPVAAAPAAMPKPQLSLARATPTASLPTPSIEPVAQTLQRAMPSRALVPDPRSEAVIANAEATGRLRADMQTPEAQQQVQGYVNQANAPRLMPRVEQSVRTRLNDYARQGVGSPVPLDAGRVSPGDLQAAAERGLSANYDYSSMARARAAAPNAPAFPELSRRGTPITAANGLARQITNADMEATNAAHDAGYAVSTGNRRMTPADAAAAAGLNVTPTPVPGGDTRMVMSGGTDLSPQSDVYRQQMARQGETNFQSALQRQQRQAQIQGATPEPTPARLAYAGNAQGSGASGFMQQYREAQQRSLQRQAIDASTAMGPVEAAKVNELNARTEALKNPKKEGFSPRGQALMEQYKAQLSGYSQAMDAEGAAKVRDQMNTLIDQEFPQEQPGGGAAPAMGGGAAANLEEVGTDSRNGKAVFRDATGKLVYDDGTPAQ